jgi:dienelactone hydrolase
MAEIVLFHHAHGLTPGVTALADRWRVDGHVVHVPDLFDGATFDDLADGVAFAERIGFDEIADRGMRAVADLPSRLVVVGLSLGVLPAQRLAQTRGGAVGAVLVSACVPLGAFGDVWPGDLPLQVHLQADDPIVVDDGDLDAARELVASTADGELFISPGADHLTIDASLPSFDPAAAQLFLERVARLLARIDAV